MKVGLDPIANENSCLLILGSLPGDMSIKQQQYYAHPKNHFWPIIASLLNEQLPNSYDERKEMLLRNSIALWDVLHKAEREGSLDTNIKKEQPNDLARFLSDHPKISFIILNGTAANKCFKKHFPKLQNISHAAVRSSSPVPARECNTLQEKIINWHKAWEKAGFCE